MRVNNLGKLGIGLFFLGIIVFLFSIYNAIINPFFSNVLGFQIDNFSIFLVFANSIILILIGIMFYFASKTRRSKIE